jgi:endonuclease/exonuclease/phosphatase family metal-dependent hydrolase
MLAARFFPVLGVFVLIAEFAVADVVRIMAANTSSGRHQNYDVGEGNRMFRGLRPDIALVQEMNTGENKSSDYRAWVDAQFGPEFFYHVEEGEGLPNGIVSRFPILEDGEWDDPEMDNRDFAWARIDVPGDRDLWAVSVHWKASPDGAGRRARQAESLAQRISEKVPEGDLLVVGGDLNTHSEGESAVKTLERVLEVDAARPVDQRGRAGTNAKRSVRLDWILADADLEALAVPLRIGENEFPQGLVFDSRDYEPLEDVAPVTRGDSAAEGMQHMPVLRAFQIE